MAVDSMHLGVWSWSRQSPELRSCGRKCLVDARGQRRMGRL